MKKLKLIVYFTLILAIFLSSVFSNADAVNMMISDHGIEFIKSFEGFSAFAYWDYSQYSIGYGTACEKDQYPDGITEEFADQLLRETVLTYVGYVNAFLNKYSIKVNQNQFDALTSFTYNLGNVWTRDDNTLKRMLIEGIENYTDDDVKYAFGLWCKAGGKVNEGLVRRRAAEANLFLSDEDFGTPIMEYEVWKTTASSGLRLRSGPGTNYSQVSLIPLNTMINVTEKKQVDGFLWGKTVYKGVSGWCALDYAQFIEAYTQPTTTTTTSTTTSTTTATTTTIPTTTINQNTTGSYSGPMIYGDVNKDGRVNSKDVLLFKKHVANWKVEINLPACDVNVDSTINAKDILLLRQYLANWNVELGKAPETTTTEITTEIVSEEDETE